MTSFYNLSFLDNSTGFDGLVMGVQTNSDNFYMPIFMFTIYMLLFIALIQFEAKNAFIVSSFVTSILAGLAFGAGLLATWILAIPILLLVISVFVKVWSDT